MPDNPFYQTEAWKLAREQALARDNYLCRRCLERNILTRATEVHHIKPIETHPWLALVLDNLISLCAMCHNQVEKRNKAKEKNVRKRKARIVKS